MSIPGFRTLYSDLNISAQKNEQRKMDDDGHYICVCRVWIKLVNSINNVRSCVHVCVCVCVCVRARVCVYERERERERAFDYLSVILRQ